MYAFRSPLSAFHSLFSLHMTSERLIDVLIPTYNPKQEHLTVALASLQAQTFQGWQAFIHDDCSPNGETEAIVRPFLTDSRITFKRSPDRLGIGGNWNACLRSTSAPIVAYLFQDDLWHPNYLAAAYKALNDHSSVGFVSLKHEYRGEGGMTNLPLYESIQEYRRTKVTPGLHSGREFLRYWIQAELHPNIVGEPDFVVMKREVMVKAGPFLEDMPQFLDTEYWLRLLTFTDWYNLTAAEYGVFRVHPSAASAVNQVTGQGIFDRLQCFEVLTQTLKGDDRKIAIAARNRALQNMIAKFFMRIRSGNKVSGKGSSGLKSFILRHPWVIIHSVIEYFLKKA